MRIGKLVRQDGHKARAKSSTSKARRQLMATPFAVFCVLTALTFPHASSYVKSLDLDGSRDAARLNDAAISFGAALALVVLCLVAGLYYSLCVTLDRTLTTEPVYVIKGLRIHHFYLQGVIVTLGVALSRIALQTLRITDNIVLCTVIFLVSAIAPAATRKGGLWELPANQMAATVLLTIFLPFIVIFF